MTLTPGARLGPYEVTAQIGVGGMGEVYRATDTNLKRAVAIKVLPASVAADVERLARFQREAELLASLNHPNIAAIYGLERTPAMTALVMELVEGPTLADRIAQGAIPIDEALSIAKQIAEALEAAHEQGVIHRDLKPANIKVRPDGAVKVLDFGLAKAMEAPGGMSPGMSQSPTITSPAMMTGVGMILGTAAYMSPEQARGKSLDRRTDIWAFGAVLFEMLTGTRAFGGDDVQETLVAIMRDDPEWARLPPTLSPGIATYLRRCVQKDPRQRVQAIGDMRLALEGAFETGTIHGSHGADVTRPPWRLALPVAAAVVAGALLAGAVMWSRWPTAASPRVSRFDYVLPDGQPFRNATRPVAAISPDGRHFVYNTVGGLYLRTMGELEPRLIPGTVEGLTSPFFSPDGEFVGYWQNGQLKRIPITGGTATVICTATNPLGVSWSAGDVILFGQPAGVMRVSAHGGIPELIIPARDAEEVYGPQLLPGQDSVLLSVTAGNGTSRWNKGQVVVQSLSSGERTVVVEAGSDAHYLPSGHLVYALEDGLFGVPFDAERLTVPSGAVPLVQGIQRSGGLNVTGVAHYAVSDEGTLVYVTDSAALRSLFWVDRRGTTAELVTSIPAAAYEAPRLSPDGARVVAERAGDIWIYDIASGRSSRLTRDGANVMAVWDPTGLRVAYSSDRGGNLEAWVQRSDGSVDARQVTNLGGQVHVDSWSPDGRTLAIHHHPHQGPVSMQMVSMDEANPKPQFFLARGLGNEAATFSPDGRYVAYVSVETGQPEIYIRPYPGPGGQETVSVGGGLEPVWTKSGEVFYRDLAARRMMTVSVTTQPTLKVGRPEQLFEGPYFRSATGSLRPGYDVTADGRRFLLMSAGSGANASGSRPRIVVVHNWFEDLRRLVPTD